MSVVFVTVKNNTAGTLFKLAGLASALGSLALAIRVEEFSLYLRPERGGGDRVHNYTVQVEALFIFLIGLAVAFLLFRLGAHFRSQLAAPITRLKEWNGEISWGWSMVIIGLALLVVAIFVRQTMLRFDEPGIPAGDSWPQSLPPGYADYVGIRHLPPKAPIITNELVPLHPLDPNQIKIGEKNPDRP